VGRLAKITQNLILGDADFHELPLSNCGKLGSVYPHQWVAPGKPDGGIRTRIARCKRM